MAVHYIKYDTEGSVTLTIASLASDTGLVIGRASTAIDNATTKYLDVMISGKIAIHATNAPTANSVIELWAYAQLQDTTPEYPDGITGTDAAKTLTSINIKLAGLRPLWTAIVDNVAGRTYPIPPTSLAERFGVMPKKWGIYLVHNTGQTLAASGHLLKYQGILNETV